MSIPSSGDACMNGDRRGDEGRTEVTCKRRRRTRGRGEKKKK